MTHRERFNSFGISLRKNRHYDDSVLFYTKALELNAQDEHVYFNMARAQFDKGDVGECLRHLNIALAPQSGFAEAQKFLDSARDSSRAVAPVAGGGPARPQGRLEAGGFFVSGRA
jgi:tetratricopeptide (TPR) repeat protein